jgi:D-alanine transaminase
VTRGAAPRKHAFPANATPLELMWVQDLIDPYVKGREQGIRVLTQPDQRWKRCDIKTTNLLANVLAIQAAAEADCTEALLYGPDGIITEGTHSNVFAVVGGKLRTSATTDNILAGCTRGLIVRLAEEAGIATELGGFHKDRLHEVSEVFMSGTTAEVLPVSRIDRTPVGDGVPGPVTRRLQALYSETVEKFRVT